MPAVRTAASSQLSNRPNRWRASPSFCLWDSSKSISRRGAPWIADRLRRGIWRPLPFSELTNVRSEREQLYAEISVEVDALEKQGGLLKKVVRLATPTVVHIETIKTSHRLLLAPNAGGGRIRCDRRDQ